MECCHLLPVEEFEVWQVEQWTAHLLHRFHQGRCLLPTHMGLGEWRYQQLCRQYNDYPVADEAMAARQQLLAELLASRQSELQQLHQWLLRFAVPNGWLMAEIIAIAAMGFSHLWQDLGLDSRQELKELMRACFPELVERNHKNMRWKKFFYRELCQEDGGLVCRAPSCDVCTSYAECFVSGEH
jgi:NifQ.